MRFSDEYRRLQAPQWASRYITYDRFKTAIKVEHGLAQKENRWSNFSCKADFCVSYSRKTDHIQPSSQTLRISASEWSDSTRQNTPDGVKS